MPLSEHEQRVLEQIESGLYADDPKFASTVRRNSARPQLGRAFWKYLTVGALGLVLLVLGLAFGPKPGGFPVISLLGFIVMFAAGVAAMVLPGRGSAQNGLSSSAPHSRRSGSGPVGFGPATSSDSKRSGRSGGSFSARMEDRFRRRFEGPQY